MTFKEYLNEVNKPLTDGERRLLDIVTAEFKTRNDKELERWGEPLSTGINIDSFIHNHKVYRVMYPELKTDGTRKNRVIKDIHALIEKGYLKVTNDSTSRHHYNTAKNFGRDITRRSMEVRTILVIPTQF
jgi:hypothetical protein